MNAFEQQYLGLLDAVRVQLPGRYYWFGTPWSVPSARQANADVLVDQRELVRTSLQQQMYESFYCTGRPVREAIPDLDAPATSDAAFQQQLIAANHGVGPWQSGWELTTPGEQNIVSRGGLTLTAAPTQVRWIGISEMDPTAAQVRMAPELLGMSPGFFMAVGDTDLNDRADLRISRLYWHTTPSSALELFSLLTRDLNDARVPYRLKTLKSVRAYARCDSTVLYVPKDDVDLWLPIIRKAHQRVRHNLRDGVPAMTKRLARGLSAADDPGDDESFGTHRCGLLASAFVGNQGLSLNAIASAFEDAGLDGSSPYLNGGEQDVYARMDDVAKIVGRPHVDADPLPPLDVAKKIGDWLCGSAYWADGRCNWFGGSSVAPAHVPGGAAELANGSLDGDVYNGTAGVALFLAQLARVTHDLGDYRSTALGAIRQALAAVEAEHLPQYGLYIGSMGAALAALEISELLEDAPLEAETRQVLAGLLALRSEHGEEDLTAGLSGDILAALNARSLLGVVALEAAVAWGDELIGKALDSGGTLSWPTETFGTQKVGLTGLSHGAAGMGLALAELAAATGQVRFRKAADCAFAYERSHFDPTASNWADLRWYSGKRSRGNWTTHAPYWCHGAPGIALSRVRAAAVTGCAKLRDEAVAGLQATRNWLGNVFVGNESLVLCHGLLGNAEVLRLAADYGYEQPEDSVLLASVAEGVSKLFRRAPNHWPCHGAAGVMTPGMMCGIAGIGHFYVRSVGQFDSILLPVTRSNAVDSGSANSRTIHTRGEAR